MAITDRVTDLVVPILEPFDLYLYDVEMAGSTLRITVNAEGGVNLDRLAEVTRLISATFDEVDPMPGKYTLEVSSPGLERRVRTVEHFQASIGEVLNVKLGPQVDGPRRLRGELKSADDEQIAVCDTDGVEHILSMADITKATTVFEWGPAPKPGQSGSKTNKKAARDKQTDRGAADRKVVSR